MNQRLNEIIEANKKDFEQIGNRVWEFAELGFQEVRSAKLQREYMEQRGFRITCPVAGMETAFLAETGSGKPVLALLGENDALANLSQVADVVRCEPVVANGNGHGCGHNLLGTGAMEAACALKTYMEEQHILGTLRFYACPAEEGGGGKVIMAAKGVFSDVDAALTWHPGADNNIKCKGLACITANFTFTGEAAHASAQPWDGRSALDALELMNVGTQFLREHITPDARIHYAILDAGGLAPNVVQNRAAAQYVVRAATGRAMEDIYRRVCNIAKGAALMTGTTVATPEIVSAYREFVPNYTINDLAIRHFRELVPVQLTEEERAYLTAYQKLGMRASDEQPLDTSVDDGREARAMASSDCGDASFVMPFLQAMVATVAVGTRGHNWTMTAQGKSSVSHKGMHLAAKLLGATLLDLFTDAKTLEGAKKEHRERISGEPYHTLMPVD